MSESSRLDLEPRVDVSGVDVDADRLVGPVSAERMRSVVERLAASPRHVVDDHDRALAAARLVDDAFVGLGLAVESVAAHASDVSLPTLWTEIPGTATQDVFVFAAHYDTVAGSPGADDNASGVAGLLEMARVLSESPLPAGVVLGSVPFEETGSFAGAEALARAISPRRNVIGMISLEMIGFASPEPDRLLPGAADFLAIVGDEGSAPLIHTFHSAATAWYPDLRLVPIAMDPDQMRHVTRSDHSAFWKIGVPAAMATDTAEFRNPNYHQPSDTPDTLDYGFARHCVGALLVGASAYTALHVKSGVPDIV